MYQSCRPLIFAALLSVAGFISCQKSSVEPAGTSSNSIVGRWELTRTSGGIGGGTRPADPQHYQEIAFMANGQALTLLNGKLTATGTYTLGQAVSQLTQRPETFLRFRGLQMDDKPFIAELSATTLVLSDDYFDGYSATYRREQPKF